MEQTAGKGRFAPTPSGRMHLGNVLCSLLAWLSARSKGSSMVLRIEDLEKRVCPPEFAELLEQDLQWLGLDWEEGGSSGGPDAPYFQSLCSEIYQESYQMLEKKGLLYPCFCSRSQLHSVQAPHQSDGRVVYPGTCKGLGQAQIQRLAREKPPAMRVMIPDETILFQDWNYGEVRQNLARECGDFVVRRGDGVFTYQLAVVIDDARMGVTEVVRGNDLLSSTPQQIWLYQTLGLPVPEFGHIPLLNAPDGRRLSKRDEDLDLGKIRSFYGGPEPVLGMLAHLCGLIDRPEPVTAKELIPEFAWDKLPKQDICLPQSFYAQWKG